LKKGVGLTEEGQQKGPVSLEEYFVEVVGGAPASGEEEVLQWLG